FLRRQPIMTRIGSEPNQKKLRNSKLKRGKNEKDIPRVNLQNNIGSVYARRWNADHRIAASRERERSAEQNCRPLGCPGNSPQLQHWRRDYQLSVSPQV